MSSAELLELQELRQVSKGLGGGILELYSGL